MANKTVSVTIQYVSVQKRYRSKALLQKQGQWLALCCKPLTTAPLVPPPVLASLTLQWQMSDGQTDWF